MGAAWCRERAAKAQDSKSPFDRVIVKCVNQLNTTPESHTTEYSGRIPTRPSQGPSNVNLENIPAKPTVQPNSSTGWQEVVLKVPDQPDEYVKITEKAPIPPPRKKKTIREKPEEKYVHVLRKPSTPVIYLEVGTPPRKPRSISSISSLESSEKRVLVNVETDLLHIPHRAPSSASMTSRRSISSLSEVTSEKLDNYLKSCRSFGSLKPEDLAAEINQVIQSDDSSDSDAWAGLDDWDLGIVDHDARTGTPPLTPTSQLMERKAKKRPEFIVGNPGTDKEPKKKSAGKEKKPKHAKKQRPVNFESHPQSTIVANTTTGSLIKPSQIPVKDFLRQSSSSPKGKKHHNLRVDTSGSSTFSFDFRTGLAPPHSPQIELPGTPNTPRGLSRCNSPLPKQFINSTTPPSSPSAEDNALLWSNEEDVSHATLLKLLNEYHTAAELLGDDDAKKILKNLGIPDSIMQGNTVASKNDIHTTVEAIQTTHTVGKQVFENNGSSGRSSMTPSLTELENALTDLLETTPAKDGDDDEELQKTASMYVPIQEVHAKQEVCEDVKNKESIFTPIQQEPQTRMSMTKKMNAFLPVETNSKAVDSNDKKPAITITVCKDTQLTMKIDDANLENTTIKSKGANFVPFEKTVEKNVSNYLENSVKTPKVQAVDESVTKLEGTSDRKPIGKINNELNPIIKITLENESLKQMENDEVESKHMQDTSEFKAIKSLESVSKHEKILADSVTDEPTVILKTNLTDGNSKSNIFAAIKEDLLAPTVPTMRKSKTDNDLAKTEQMHLEGAKTYP